MGGIPTVYPFNGYGGIERIVADTAHTLAGMGYEVTVVGQSGSKIPGCTILEHNSEFDELPFSFDGVVIDFSHRKVYNHDKFSVPFWTDNMGKNPIFPSYAVMDAFGIVDGEVIYPGIDLTKYHYCGEKDDYYLYLGRIAPFKGTEVALNVAKMLGIRLVVAGHDGRYTAMGDEYARSFRDRCADIGAEYVGEVSEDRKRLLLEHARGLIFAPYWGLLGNVPHAIESFGIAAVEAIASGTPVFTSNRPGGIREIIQGEFGGAYGNTQWKQMLAYERPERQKWEDRASFFSVENYVDRLLMHTGAEK